MLRWLFALCWTPLLFAQSDEIRALLKNSEEAWNRGDLAAMVSYYQDSPETTFVGREVTRGGVQAILERYRRTYPTRDAMGKLTFSEIEIRTLAPEVALATGKFELKRAGFGRRYFRAFHSDFAKNCRRLENYSRPFVVR